MKKLLNLLSVFIILNFLFSGRCLGDDIKKINPINLVNIYKLEEKYCVSNPEDLTQYFSYDTVSNIKTKLALPYCEVILAVNDSYIVYAGVEGNLYSANKKTKNVKKVDFVGKHTYKKLGLRIFKLRDNWLYYCIETDEYSSKVFNKVNIETGEITKLNSDNFIDKILDTKNNIKDMNVRLVCDFVDEKGSYFEVHWTDKNGKKSEILYLTIIVQKCLNNFTVE